MLMRSPSSASKKIANSSLISELSSISSEDKKLAKKKASAEERRLKEEARMKKALALSAVVTETASGHPLEESSSSVTEGSNDYQPTPAKREQIQQKQTELGVTSSELFNKNVTGALDRNKKSDREAVQLMAPTAAAMQLSCSTVHRMRQKTRREFAEAAAMEYNPCCPIVVH